jgi:hypothetical protein
MQPSQPRSRPLHVAIISRNAETLEALENYLQGVGATTSSMRAIAGSPELGTRAAALVFFPDEYPLDSAIAALARWRSANPRAPFVLVTRAPRSFEAVAAEDDAALTLVVPKPAWSWTILDAIRAHLDDELDIESC